MSQVPALPGHHLAILLVQMALILTVSRLLAELMKRLGQPSVIGELLTGIVLGPSLLGWLWPGYFQTLFPADATQVHLLETVAWIGMVMLLLLTGLETDVRLLRNLGRAALTSSAGGMTVSFVSGILLGLLVPQEHLANPERRLLFAAFLATAMAITAMPVIAKILLDLELTKRNISLVILSAGVVDDTVGWLLLSLIAGIAQAQDYVFLRFLKTVGLTIVFLVACRFLVFPLVRGLFRQIDHRARTPGADLVLVAVVAFVLAAITEAIHIHAVFGAFVAGCMLRQVPTLRPATIQRFESVAMSMFAPIFFGLAGLKVELRSVTSPKLVLLVLGVATLGKIIGCTGGALVGRMRFWESLAIGVTMTARGAMELVVALIGLNLGILSPAMYASIVIMAIATSFIAPVLLRLVLHMVKMSPEEKARMAQTSQRTVFSPTRLKALLPTAGGPNALHAGRFAGALVRGEPATLTLLFVQAAESILLRIKRLFRPDPAGQNLQQHLELIKTYADERHARVEINKATDSDAVGVICREAKNGYDLILLGAGLKNPLRSGVTVQLLEHAPCHVAIMRGIGDVREPKNILVPTNGSYFTTAALELAVLYAERVGATVTVLYTMESAPDEESTFADPDAPIARGFRRMMATTLLANLSPLISKTTAKVTVVVAESAQLTEPVVRQAKSGIHQLVVIGAEDRAVQHRLSAGYDLDKVLDEAPCSVLVVVPRMGGSDHKSNH